MATTKKTAKKKTAAKAKKQQSKPKAKSNGDALIVEAKKVLARLKAGQTTMGAERDRLGFSSNRPLRLALIEILPGGRKEYDAILKSSQAAYFAAKKSKKA